jgi:hypothetical protein
MTIVNERAQQRRYPLARIRLGAVIAMAVAAALVLWLVLKDDGNDNKAATSSGAVAASPQELRAVPDSVNHPVYWAGRRAGYTYELSKTARGVYVRYLPQGVAVGDPKPRYLTIASYPYKNAYATLNKAAGKKGALSKRLPGGGVAVTSTTQPKSVYVAFPSADLQVEVYDPSAQRARKLAFSGRIVPVR